MNEILECYHENICPDQDVYYFFDEIQYAQDWDKWLKTIYDMQPDTKVVATGSASPVLVKGAGRAAPDDVCPSRFPRCPSMSTASCWT